MSQEEETKSDTIVFRVFQFKVTSWSDEAYSKSLELLQPTEVARAKRFHHLIDAKRSMSSHLMVKSILSKLHMRTIKSIAFERTKQNRPFWLLYDSKKYPGLNFNVSHSGDWSIGVVSSHAMCGIDVQEKKIPGRDKSVKNFISIMKHCFTLKEILTMCLYPSNRLNELSQKDVDLFLNFWMNEKKEELVKSRFFTFWVLKEAFIKMLGTGIYFDPLSRVEFIFENVKEDDSLSNFTPKVYVDGKLYDELFFKVFELDEAHVAALGVGPLNFSYLHENVKKTLLIDKSLRIKDVDEYRIEKVKSLKINVKFEIVEDPVKL